MRLSLLAYPGFAVVVAMVACGSDGTSPNPNPTNAVCVTHANGAAASPKSGVSKVVSNVTFGGGGVFGFGAVDDDVYVSEPQSATAAFGGLSFTAPTGQYQVFARVTDKAEWLWLAEHGQGRFDSYVSAWTGGMVALIRADGPLKFTNETGTQGPSSSASGSTTGLFLSAKAKGGAVDWIALPQLPADETHNTHLVVSREGAIFITGSFADGADFGTGALSCGGGPAIVRYDAVGKKALWARCVGTKGSAITVEGLAADNNGQPTITGFPGSNPDFGLGVKSVNADAGGTFILSLDSSGKPKRVLYTLRAYADAVVTLDDGTLFFSGNSPQDDAKNGLIDYIGQSFLPCAGDLKTVVSRVNPDGTVAWLRAFGSSLKVIHAFADKRVLLFDTQAQAATYADGLSVPLGNAPALVLVDPNGDVSAVQTLGEGSDKNLSLFGIAPTATGVWLGGSFEGTLTLKSTLTSQSSTDLVVKVAF